MSIEQSWSVSLKNIGRHNFVHNSHRTQSNPIQSMDESDPWTNPIHGHLWARLYTPETIATKFDTLDYVADIYQQKIGLNPPKGFCPYIGEIYMYTKNLV